MEKSKECPQCGSKEIEKGKMSGYTKILPRNKVLTTGSELEADICTNCGLILALRAKNPEKFR